MANTITRTEIIKALELIQRALENKHPGESAEEPTVTIRLPDALVASDATDLESEIVATGLKEIADYLHKA